MKIKQGTKIKVTLPYTNIRGMHGVVTMPAEDEPGYELHRIKLENGESVALFAGEFEVVKEADEKAITVADKLHSLLCHWNHTDGCAYYYGPEQRLRSLEGYIPKAQRMLEENSFESVTSVLDSIINYKVK